MTIIKKMTRMFTVVLLCSIAVSLLAENRFYINDFAIEANATHEVEIILDNDVDFAAFQADVTLPEGLTFVDLRTQAEINKNKNPYYFTLTDRKDDHTLAESQPGEDPLCRRIISNSINNYTYYNAADVGTAALVKFKVKAAEDFSGASTITLTGIIFAQADETEFSLNDSEATVSLDAIYVETVSLDKTNITLSPQETITLNATVLPAEAANKILKWTSSNNQVASVDQNGVVTANGIGKTTITATAQDGSGRNATCSVTVKEPVNRFYINDFAIEANATLDVEIILENEVDFTAFQADITLPEGLSFVDLRTQAEINKNKKPYYFTLTDRKDDHTLAESQPGEDPLCRRIISNSINNYTYYNVADAGTAALVKFKVKAAANFFGTGEIRIEDIVFTKADETEFKLEPTEATVEGPEWSEPTGVRLTVTSAIHGSIIFIVDNGTYQSIKLVPDEGYKLHSLTLNGEDVKESIINDYYITPALTEDATLNVAFEIATGLSETIISDRVRVTAAGGYVKVNGTIVGEQVNLYTSNGVLVNSVVSNGDEIEFEAVAGEIYIVKTLNHTVKIMM